MQFKNFDQRSIRFKICSEQIQKNALLIRILFDFLTSITNHSTSHAINTSRHANLNNFLLHSIAFNQNKHSIIHANRESGKLHPGHGTCFAYFHCMCCVSYTIVLATQVQVNALAFHFSFNPSVRQFWTRHIATAKVTYHVVFRFQFKVSVSHKFCFLIRRQSSPDIRPTLFVFMTDCAIRTGLVSIFLHLFIVIFDCVAFNVSQRLFVG